MMYSRKLLNRYRKFDVPQTVSLGDDQTVKAFGTGDITAHMTF